MPCYDPDTHERPVRLEAQVHRLTALLCSACRGIEKLREKYPDIPPFDGDLAAWWKNHQEWDDRIEAVRQKKKRLGERSLTDAEHGLLYAADDISWRDNPPLVHVNYPD